MCCISIVVTGLLFEHSIFSFCIEATVCSALLLYGTLACGSRIKTAKLLFLNSGLLALIVVLLRVILNNVVFRFPSVFWPWFHRTFGVWWSSECSAIILALLAAGLVAIQVADKIGGDKTRSRFQQCGVAAALILIVVNIANSLRPVWCGDCFFPYGLPFTFFTEGGEAGGGGIVWLGLVADAAIIPAFAALCTVVWNRIAA